ncbi:MAG: hypothetical protein HUU19_13345 [Phycisphaerales bacterium]|nr:hypothetical protein [Phycisphaerales bacterium]
MSLGSGQFTEQVRQAHEEVVRKEVIGQDQSWRDLRGELDLRLRNS